MRARLSMGHAPSHASAAPAWTHATGSLALDRPRIMAIVNVTPDSFSDGGRFSSAAEAVSSALTMLDQGADVVDVGGESTRPQGATPVTADEELRRTIPVIQGIHAARPHAVISIDTVKHDVARAALDAGAAIVNDVSGFRLDARMASLCARTGAGVVLMHSRGDVADMATFAHAAYSDDVTDDVMHELKARVAEAMANGVTAARIALDPGIGFAKQMEHSLAVLHDLRRLASLGFPVVVGVSRKRFIGSITGVETAADRVFGTVGANVAALERGARIFRVHDIRANREALDVAWAVATAGDRTASPARATA